MSYPCRKFSQLENPAFLLSVSPLLICFRFASAMMTVYSNPSTNDDIPKNSNDKAVKIKESLTIEEAVDKIVPGLTVKLVCLFIAVCCTILSTAAATYATVFTGHIPYTAWKCKSEKCNDLLNAAAAATGSTDNFHSYDTMCDNDLIAGTDFVWVSKKLTFSMKWNIYCKNESKLSLISSVYFIGSLLGLLCSTAVYDRIGRKRGAVIGSVVAILATGASAAAPSYEVLLILRIITGFSVFVHYTGSYCWIVEFAPTYLRNPLNGFFNLGWTGGYLLLVGAGYFIDSWQYIYLAIACLNVFSLIPFFLLPLPESPRFYLIKGEEEKAKKALDVVRRISGSEVILDSIELVYEERVQGYLEQIKDFRAFPVMLKETLLGMWIWFIVSTISYGYQFGWSKIGSDIYSSYFFAALGDGIAYTSVVPVCRLLGRKRATILYFGVVIVSNFIAMLDIKFYENWSLEHIISIIGSIATSSAFLMVYLYSTELAPTSHRGMIICISSSCARVGSFLGPYVSLLYGVTDRRVPLALFAGLSALAGVAVWFLPDTTGRSIPETPKDVEILSGKREKGDVAMNDLN